MVTERAAAHARQEILQIGVVLLALAALIDVVCKQTLSAAATSALAIFLARLLLGSSALGLPDVRAAQSPVASEWIMHAALSWLFVAVELPEIVPGSGMWRPEWIKWVAVTKVIYLLYLPAASYKTLFVIMRCLELLLCSALQYYSTQVAQVNPIGASGANLPMAGVRENVLYFDDAEHVMRVFGRLSLVSFNAFIVHWRVRVWTRRVSLEEQGNETDSEEESDDITYMDFVRIVKRAAARAAQRRDLTAILTFARGNLCRGAAQSSKSLPALPPTALMLSARFLLTRSSFKQSRATMKCGGGVDLDGYDSDVSVDSKGSESVAFREVKRLVHAWW